jgi:hypothetical protein
MIVRVSNAAGLALRGRVVDWTYVTGNGHRLADTAITRHDDRAGPKVIWLSRWLIDPGALLRSPARCEVCGGSSAR